MTNSINDSFRSIPLNTNELHARKAEQTRRLEPEEKQGLQGRIKVTQSLVKNISELRFLSGEVKEKLGKVFNKLDEALSELNQGDANLDKIRDNLKDSKEILEQLPDLGRVERVRRQLIEEINTELRMLSKAMDKPPVLGSTPLPDAMVRLMKPVIMLHVTTFTRGVENIRDKVKESKLQDELNGIVFNLLNCIDELRNDSTDYPRAKQLLAESVKQLKSLSLPNDLGDYRKGILPVAGDALDMLNRIVGTPPPSRSLKTGMRNLRTNFI